VTVTDRFLAMAVSAGFRILALSKYATVFYTQNIVLNCFYIKMLTFFDQGWFTECARLISQVCGQNVEWVTPLGLPIVQPYSHPNRKLEIHSSAKRIKEHYALDMFE
jgi:DNA-directed RNA polymerase